MDCLENMDYLEDIDCFEDMQYPADMEILVGMKDLVDMDYLVGMSFEANSVGIGQEVADIHEVTVDKQHLLAGQDMSHWASAVDCVEEMTRIEEDTLEGIAADRQAEGQIEAKAFAARDAADVRNQGCPAAMENSLVELVGKQVGEAGTDAHSQSLHHIESKDLAAAPSFHYSSLACLKFKLEKTFR